VLSGTPPSEGRHTNHSMSHSLYLSMQGAVPPGPSLHIGSICSHTPHPVPRPSSLGKPPRSLPAKPTSMALRFLGGPGRALTRPAARVFWSQEHQSVLSEWALVRSLASRGAASSNPKPSTFSPAHPARSQLPTRHEAAAGNALPLFEPLLASHGSASSQERAHARFLSSVRSWPSSSNIIASADIAPAHFAWIQVRTFSTQAAVGAQGNKPNQDEDRDKVRKGLFVLVGGALVCCCC
jgi:hypothetical protein